MSALTHAAAVDAMAAAISRTDGLAPRFNAVPRPPQERDREKARAALAALAKVAGGNSVGGSACETAAQLLDGRSIEDDDPAARVAALLRVLAEAADAT